MSIRLKIILAFLLMAAFLLIQTLVNSYGHNRLSRLADLTIEKNYPTIQALNGLIYDMQKLRRYEKEYFIYLADEDKKNHYAQKWQFTLNEVLEHIESLRSNPNVVLKSGDIERLDAWKTAVGFYGEEFQKVIATFQDAPAPSQTESSDAGSISIQANALIQDGKNRHGDALQDMVWMIKSKNKDARNIVDALDQGFKNMELTAMSLTGAAIVLALILIFVIPGGINHTLKRLLDDAERISKDDLSRQVERSPVPEFDSLATALEKIRKDKLAHSQRNAIKSA